VLMQISPRRRITSGWLLISCGRKIKRLLYTVILKGRDDDALKKRVFAQKRFPIS
jgi:hypothetical protein